MPPVLATGRKVGRYAIFDALASGGMATVHLGKLVGDVGFSRTVAIKRLHENLASDPAFVAMMIDEARIVSRIDHPNVVPTLDVVATDEGELFLVMEYVNGESLARLCERAADRGERIPMGVAVAIVVDALHGLHAAHEARSERGEPLGIVHRDVSPQNVLVGVDGTARVADFGVAKAAGRVQASLAGQIKGKLAYMAPEQLRASILDRRADVYAAGIVLWEALTGQSLFARDTEQATLGAALEGVAAAPSTITPELPEGLDAIVLRALARDPAARYATAHEFAVELEDALALPRPHEVGAWVMSVSAPELSARAERLAAIDAASTVMISPALPSFAERPPRPSRGRAIAIIAVVTTLAGATLYASFGARTHEPTAPVASNVPPVGAAPVPSASTPLFVVPPPAVVSVAVTASATAAATARASGARPLPSRKPPPSAAPDCEPPYVLDRDGVRVPKRECLGKP